MFSGQSIQLATSRLGETQVSETVEVGQFNQEVWFIFVRRYGATTIEMIFPNISDTSDEDESETSESDSFTSFSRNQSSGRDSVHELASKYFFEIEESGKFRIIYFFKLKLLAQGTEVPKSSW